MLWVLVAYFALSITFSTGVAFGAALASGGRCRS